MAEREGQQFGNYRLTRLLGKGAFAEVYLAEQIYLGTQAAIKVLHTQLASEAEVEKFRLEARTIATLVHPHIVRVLDFGVQDGTPYLLMDYAPNGSLRQRFPAATPLAPATILPHIKQVADALSYAHEQRLIHRDVKPENMLLGRSSETLLSDFGIALVAQSSDYQQTQGIAGTAAYMAPEQLQGKPRPASDQYALGVVTYEWLSGERPFHGTFTEVAGQHMLAPPPPLRQKVPSLSPAIEQVVLTALSKDPKDRFATISAFANALEQAILSGGTQVYATQAQTPPVGGTQAYATQAQPSIYAAPTVISAPPDIQPPGPNMPPGVGTIGSWPTAPGSMQQGGMSPGSGPAVNAGWAASVPPTPPPYNTTGTFSTSMPGPVSPLAPGQTPPKQGIPRRTVVIAGVAGLALIGGGTAAYELLSHNSSHSSSPGTGLNGGTTPGSSASPTGTTSATATATSATSPTATETPTSAPPQPGDTVFILSGHTEEVSSVAWAPNSQQLVSGSFDDTACVWNAGSGQSVVTYTGHTDQVWGVAWSPNGQYIASCGRDKTVKIWTPNGNLASDYTGNSDFVAAVTWSPDSVTIASASYDHTVWVWEAITQHYQYTFNGHTDQVWAVDWSPNGQWVTSGSKDKTVWVWDPTGKAGSYTYTGHTDSVAAVAWSPNSKRIASGGYDRTVQVWDAMTFTNVVIYRGHRDVVTGIAWSPNGQYIASSSKDGTVQVWQASNAQPVLTYSKHGSGVEAVSWAANGQQIASASDDRTVRTWLAPN